MKHAFSLSLSSLKSRPLMTGLSALSVTCGIALLCALFLLTHGIEEGMSRNSRNIDVVVGAKGSPLQLVLSSVYHADIPNGNIEMKQMEDLSRNPRIKKMIPLTIGDNYKGWRVAGTTPDYLDLYGGSLKTGRIFQKPFEVVAGASTHLKIGEKFAASHGFSADSDDVHDAYLYEVVGILAPTGTVADKLLMTPFESVQQLHAHHEDHEEHHESAKEEAEEEAFSHQITALLIQVRSPLDVMTLPRQINQDSELLAASPAYEMTRLSKNLGLGKNLVLALSLSIIFLSMVMLFSSLASGLATRQYDLAILRVLGASPSTLFATVLFEGMGIGLIGSIGGLIIGHILAFLMGANIEALQSLIVSQTLLIPHLEDLYLLALGSFSGCIAALLPAFSAARTDIANLLAKGAA